MKAFTAEFVGTLTLVLFGCGAAVLGGSNVGQLGIALAFGFAIIAMAYGIGPISGCHVNPAVSLAVFLSGSMSLRDMLLYWAAQFSGALAGAAILLAIAGPANGLGQNGWGPGYLGEYNMLSALIFEVVATFLFLVTILGVTRKGTPLHIAGFAGMAIGLTLAVIHIVGINVTGVSVNPARSLGPALLAGGNAMGQLWLFIVAPVVGAAAAGLLFRAKVLSAED